MTTIIAYLIPAIVRSVLTALLAIATIPTLGMAWGWFVASVVSSLTLMLAISAAVGEDE